MMVIIPLSAPILIQLGTYNPNFNGVCFACPDGAVCKNGLIYPIQGYRLIYLDDGNVDLFTCPKEYCQVAISLCKANLIGKSRVLPS